ncbi:MAG: acyl-CoA dehydrogenase family protein [Candidatus Nanopelagicales bacterium]
MSELDPAQLEAFRADVREWLATVAKPRTEEVRIWGEGDPELQIFIAKSEEDERAHLDRVREYRKARFDAGFGALTLPEEFGGRGLPSVYAVAFADEEREFDVPPSSELISVTTGLVGAAVSVFGTPEQREQYARAFLRTDELCCQLFSEPGAGSDLAGLSTKAVRDGDEWVVDGQKIWTSNAQFSAYGFMLARTDPDVVKQGGITAFLVKMDSPGIEIRPIRQMSGPSSFNEVFFDGVRIPDSMRIGDVNDGWKVAMATLGFERSSSGSGHRRKGGTVADLVELAKALGVNDDPVVRQEIADVYVRARLHAAVVAKVARANASGDKPGPAGSLGKLIASDNLVRIGNAAADMLGSSLVADTGEWGQFAWSDHVLGAPGYRLAGGTDEIQRNIIAERVLGLPAEHRADKAPFSQLSKN